MMGGRILGGRFRIAPATFSRTSWAALSMSRSSRNLHVIRVLPSVDCGFNSSRPLIVLISSSSGRTTCVVTSSDVAPGSRTFIGTVAGSALGKRSTPRSRNEKTPSTTRNVISMTANTGRFTHNSASVIRKLQHLYGRSLCGRPSSNAVIPLTCGYRETAHTSMLLVSDLDDRSFFQLLAALHRHRDAVALCEAFKDL